MGRYAFADLFFCCIAGGVGGGCSVNCCVVFDNIKRHLFYSRATGKVAFVINQLDFAFEDGMTFLRFFNLGALVQPNSASLD